MDDNKSDFLQALRNYASELPLSRFLGLNFDVDKGCIRFDMRDELVGNQHFNILHGGAIASILDSLGGFLLALDGAWRSEKGSANPILIKGGTIDLHIDYLRPGKGKHFVASGTILRRGNKVAVVQSELRNENDELIAVGLGTYLVG